MSEKLCLYAVKLDGMNLKYVKASYSYTSSSSVIKRQVLATITFPDFEKYYSYLNLCTSL
jgi:hypothetical protein